jgi:hypothetical protein
VDEALLERLRGVSQEHFARTALKIHDKDGETVALDCTHRPGQAKLNEAIIAQEKAELPVRIILVKSRQFGGSTWIQGYMVKKAVTRRRRRILTVAQKMDTSASLFGMCETMYSHLPPALRPPLAGYNNPTRGQKVIWFGEKSGGFVTGGLDSKIQIDTAAEYAGGRGLTYTDLHLTECAHWEDPRKALALLPTVGKRPGTSIFLESTANSMNWFHARYKAAMGGMSAYEAVFVGWWEDPDCSLPFASPLARAEFVASIGDESASPYAEEEPYLVEQFGCTPEQLYFRRTTIIDECEGKAELFKQEYPATWDEAFIGSGNQVFSVVLTQKAIREAEAWKARPAEEGGPQRGIFRGVEPRERRLMDGTVLVPSKVLWVPERDVTEGLEWWPGLRWAPRDPLWTRWELPQRTAEEWRQAHAAGEVDAETMERGQERALAGPRQHVLACDPADDIENNSPTDREEHAFNAAVVIDHLSGEQVAEFEGRIDHDVMARHLYLAGLFYGEGWLSIEATGGWGNSMLKTLWQRFSYKRMFERVRVESRKDEKMRDRLGWDTNKATKAAMEYGAQEMLREQTHGIRSVRLALQFTTYIRNEKGKHEPAPGCFSDLLMAWLQAQEVRRLKPPMPPPRKGPRPNSMVRPRPPRLR